ncbi:hypothetical protein INR49_011100 [Caranx melampygus]|nr:hypothetical protein INR49_011100 [Caranx melampygus]
MMRVGRSPRVVSFIQALKTRACQKLSRSPAKAHCSLVSLPTWQEKPQRNIVPSGGRESSFCGLDNSLTGVTQIAQLRQSSSPLDCKSHGFPPHALVSSCGGEIGASDFQAPPTVTNTRTPSLARVDLRMNGEGEGRKRREETGEEERSSAQLLMSFPLPRPSTMQPLAVWTPATSYLH